MSIKILALNNDWGGLVQLLLERAGDSAQAVTASSEQDALHRLQGEHFDLLILEEFSPTGGSGEAFLEKWRFSTKHSKTLTLVITPSKGPWPSGFVRAPMRPREAHAYINNLVGPDELLEVVSRLLAGASIQRLPGDEGYTRYKDETLGIAFSYPAFWVVRKDCVREDRLFRRCYVNAVGPMDYYRSPYSIIGVAVYCPHTHNTYLKDEEMMHYELGKWMKDIQAISGEHEVEICGLRGNQAEFTWSKEVDVVGDLEALGRSIITVVRRDLEIYMLTLSAAQERFDDYRPAYRQLLESFEFLKRV